MPFEIKLYINYSTTTNEQSIRRATADKR